MTTPKACFKGDGAGTSPRNFSDTLKTKLRGYYPDQQAVRDPAWEHPADSFVAHVLSEAQWAVSQLHWQQFDITSQEIRAEKDRLLKVLKNAHDKLLSLSPDFDRLLAVQADPLGCADRIKVLIGHIECAPPLNDKLPTAQRPIEKQYDVMVEMAIRILRVLKDYGIAPAATGDANFDYTSDAVEILRAIGDDIGLVRASLTWRDTIIAAQKAVPDLQ